MRTLNTDAQALMARIAAGEQIPWAQLIELRLSETVRFSTSGHDVVWAGHTWLRSGLGTVEPIEDSAGELQGIRLSMPGIDGSQIGLALVEPVEGRDVLIYDALIDPTTGIVADAVLAWAGTLNVPEMSDGAVASVTVTAEHRGLLAVRPKPRRYTNEEQQRRYSGDTCFDFDPATDAAPIAWPKASFFRQ